MSLFLTHRFCYRPITLNNEAEGANKTIRELMEQLVNQEQLLQAASDDFKAAVEAQANCKLSDVLTFLSSVIAVASGAYAAITALASEVTKSAITLADVQNITKNVKSVSGDIQEMRTLFLTVKDRLAGHSVEIKVVMKREEIEHILSTYIGLEQARAYKDRIELYWNTIDACNQKIADRTGLVLNARLTESQIAINNEEINRLKDVQAPLMAQHARLTERVVYMGKLLSHVKQGVIRGIYEEFRAYEYWSLKMQSLNLGNGDIDKLLAVQADLVGSVQAAKVLRNGANENFETPTPVVVSAQDHPEDFDRFRTSGKLGFAIRLEHEAFAGIGAALTVRHVRISIPKATTTSGRLRAILTHQGVCSIKDEVGNIHVFTHQPRRVVYAYIIATGQAFAGISGNLRGDDEYADLSPFACWLLEVRKQDNAGLSLAAVDEVQLTFEGFFR